MSSFWRRNGNFLERPQQGLQGFNSITNLQIYSCSDLVSFPEVCFFSNLESLKLNSCSSLRFIVNGQLPSSLKRLEVQSCEKLEYLWDDREVSCTSVVDEESSSNTSTSLLKDLHVSNYISLTSFSLIRQLPTTLSTLFISGVPELESIAESFDDNKSLENICIEFCQNLKTITKSLHNFSGLQRIYIRFCHSIVNLAEDGLPNDNLSELDISWCGKLEGLPKGFHSLNSLKRLSLGGRCPRMRSFPEEGFPTNITSLEIDVEVEFYKPLLEWGLHNLTSLTSLRIWGHPEAESFPEQEMGMKLPSSLTYLHIYNFPNFKWLLSEGFQNLNSLERLEIYDFQDQTSFPKLALPSSLQSLDIQYCPDLTSISELDLPSSLRSLTIKECPGLTSISALGLPSSLQSLEIYDCPGLTSISELSLPSSLQSLEIYDCPGLTSISELSLPSSLQYLEICDCPGLTSISELGLPPSLLELHISDCPMLKEWCKRNKGKKLSKISHIPLVMIDDIFFYDTEDEE